MPQTATQIYLPTQTNKCGVPVSRPQSQPGFMGSWCIGGVDAAAATNATLSTLRKTRPLPPDTRPV